MLSDRGVNQMTRSGAVLSKYEVREGFQADSPFQLGLVEGVPGFCQVEQVGVALR